MSYTMSMILIRLKKKYALLFILAICISLSILLFSRAAKADAEVSPASAGDSVTLPIVMYHHVMSSERRAGKYIISSETLENDLKYLQKHGYKTVDTQDLINFVYNAEPLPEKPIMLTFDDGFESVFALVAPLMEKYGMCCVASVIGSVTDMFSENEDHNLSYSYLTWDEAAILSEGENVEIQNHSYDMHYSVSNKRRGMSRLPKESDGEYLKAVRKDIELCQNKITQATCKAPDTIVYPFGRYNDLLESLIKDMGFKVSLVCEERINTVICKNTESLYKLGRFNRPSGITSEAFFREML